MATLQGRWRIRIDAINAGWRQRFRLDGSNQDGGHELGVGGELVDVEGRPFEVVPQAFDPTVGDWVDSAARETWGWRDGVSLVLTIAADDNPSAPDVDYDDLIVICIAQDDELVSPNAGVGRQDLTVPEQYVRFD